MCVHCGLPTQRNFGSFDTLPLVEFIPNSRIPEKRVMDALRMDPPDDDGALTAPARPKQQKAKGGPDGWNENNPDGEEQTLTFDQ